MRIGSSSLSLTRSIKFRMGNHGLCLGPIAPLTSVTKYALKGETWGPPPLWKTNLPDAHTRRQAFTDQCRLHHIRAMPTTTFGTSIALDIAQPGAFLATRLCAFSSSL